MLTMKRLAILLMAIVICVPTLEARKRRPKAGKIKDSVYTDAEYDFQLTLHEGWSTSVKKKDDPFRLVMVQKNWEVPPDYLDAEDYTKVPRLTVFVGSTPMSAFAFMDSLLSDDYSSDQKNDILKEFEIINDQALGDGTEREEVVTRKRRSLTVDDQRAVMWQGKVKYVNYVTQSASSQAGKRVYGDYQGGIVAVKKKKDDMLILFHVICEGLYFPAVWAEAETIIESLKFGQ